MKQDRSMLTPAQAAELLMISPVTLRQWSQNRKIKYHSTPGGHRRYYLNDIINFAKKNKCSLRYKEHNERQTILIVDDDLDLLEIFKFHIKSVLPRAKVITASDGFIAGAMLHKHLPKVIILDLNLPGSNGLVICQHIRAIDWLKNVFVVGITGSINEKEIQEFRNSGADVILRKPISKSSLIGALSEYFVEKELQGMQIV